MLSSAYLKVAPLPAKANIIEIKFFAFSGRRVYRIIYLMKSGSVGATYLRSSYRAGVNKKLTCYKHYAFTELNLTGLPGFF